MAQEKGMVVNQRHIFDLNQNPEAHLTTPSLVAKNFAEEMELFLTIYSEGEFKKEEAHDLVRFMRAFQNYTEFSDNTFAWWLDMSVDDLYAIYDGDMVPERDIRNMIICRLYMAVNDYAQKVSN